MGLILVIEILTLFPAIIEGFLSSSIIRRAQDSGILDIKIHNLRSFTFNKHQQADDYIFGGGAGMLLKPEPFFRAMKTILEKSEHRPIVIIPTANGIPFKQSHAEALSSEKHLIFLCGHYKGIDQRVIERYADLEFSIGDYVITGGELATSVIIDATIRFIPGVLGDFDSARGDSFQGNRLGAPNYTRPEDFEGMKVPEVLLSGNHQNIYLWQTALEKIYTRLRRPDLLMEINNFN